MFEKLRRKKKPTEINVKLDSSELIQKLEEIVAKTEPKIKIVKVPEIKILPMKLAKAPKSGSAKAHSSANCYEILSGTTASIVATLVEYRVSKDAFSLKVYGSPEWDGTQYNLLVFYTEKRVIEGEPV